MQTLLNLREWAERLRVKGSNAQADIAAEILDLIDIEEDVAEPFSDLCASLDDCAPDEFENKPARAMEWLVDRERLLVEIEEFLADQGLPGDADDVIREQVDTLADIREALEKRGDLAKYEGDILACVLELLERPEPLKYDL